MTPFASAAAPARTALSGPPVCWVVTDGKPGMENQCLGLAEALGLAPEIKRIRPRAPWRWLPPSLWVAPFAALDRDHDRLSPPWPELLIASGRAAAAPAAAVKQAAGSRCLVVQVQDPRLAPDRFDLVVAPAHDRLRGANVVPTVGALNRVSDERLTDGAERFGPALSDLPRPLVAVLVGGSNGAYRLSSGSAARLGARLAGFARRHGAGLAITASRRTGAAAAAALREALRETPCFFWNGIGENPYFGLLGLADAILVTCDSVAMASEACATGKPVYVVALPGRAAKFERFHARLRAAGMARRFDGRLDRWSYPPLADTQRVAAIVRERLAALAAPGRTA